MMKHLQYTLQDNFEKHGLWWLPDEPDNEIGGILRFEPGKLPILELVGTFRSGWPNNERFKTEIIQGVTSDGIECTLCNNRANENFSAPGFLRQVFYSQYILLGHHFDAFDEIQFNSYAVNYEYIEDWLFQRPYTFDVEHAKGKFEYNIHWPARTLFNEKLPKNGGTISLTTDLKTLGNSATELRVQSEAYLKLEPDSPQHFEQFRKLFFDIQHFFTLLFGVSTFPRRISGFIKKEGNKTTLDWPVTVYYNLPITPLSITLYRHEMLLPYDTIGEQLPMFLDSWLSNADKLRPVYDLFFSSLAKSDMFIENRFLNLVHALESFHRLMVGGQYVPSEEYDKYKANLAQFISEIIPSSSNDLRNALRSKLEWGNEFSLRSRIKSMLRELSDELRASVTEQSIGDFVEKIVKTRNELVHQGKTQIMGDEEMYYVCQRLRILLTILLLQTLGLENVSIKKTIGRNRRIQPWDNKD